MGVVLHVPLSRLSRQPHVPDRDRIKRSKRTINKQCVYDILLFYNTKRIVAFVISIQYKFALYGG